jgi:hypothetical protein
MTAACCAALVGLGAVTAEADAMPRQAPALVARPGAEASEVAFRRGFYVVGGFYYYNGHRGYFRARPGYRYYRGYWFPAAAFAAGAVAGAVAASPAPRPAARLAAAHVRWCHAHYASYRAWDNTYQPYVGPRRPCISPYG